MLTKTEKIQRSEFFVNRIKEAFPDVIWNVEDEGESFAATMWSEPTFLDESKKYEYEIDITLYWQEGAIPEHVIFYLGVNNDGVIRPSYDQTPLEDAITILKSKLEELKNN